MEVCAQCVRFPHEVPHQEGTVSCPTACEHYLLTVHLLQVDIALSAGLRTITWSSLNITCFLQKVDSTLREFETFKKQVICICPPFLLPLACGHIPVFPQVQDLHECRIQTYLEKMAGTVLLDMLPSETWSIDHFLQQSQVRLSQPFIFPTFMHASVCWCRNTAGQRWKCCRHAVGRWRRQ